MQKSDLDVLFTAPHPDDLEIGMGGTIAKLSALGYRVGMIHMTSGEPTPRGTPETRKRETAEASEILGATVCETLTLPNRELMDVPANRYALASVVRKYRPRILVGLAGRTPAGSPDHYQAQLLTEAVRFYSQLTKWDDRFENTEPWRVDHLVYRPVPMAAEIHHWPTRFVVDITETMDKKLAAVSCYRSQFDGPRLERVLHYIRSTCGADGALSGFAFGEQYALPRLLGVTDPVQLLGDWQIPPPFDPTHNPNVPSNP